MSDISGTRIEDIITWDVRNWSRALDFWREKTDLDKGNLDCLELGSNEGGLSLLLASNGHRVICSDIESPEKSASPIHARHGVLETVEYMAIDATNIPFENRFDLIAFKSILGGIGRVGKEELTQRCIDQIYNALDEGGVLLFSENLRASPLHRLLRRRFVSWGKEWNYLKSEEILDLLHDFRTVDHVTLGFFGAFGRSEAQRKFLSFFDSYFDFLIPTSWRYIISVVAVK